MLPLRPGQRSLDGERMPVERILMQPDGIGPAKRHLEIGLAGGSVASVNLVGRLGGAREAAGDPGRFSQISGATVGAAEAPLGYQGVWIRGHRHNRELQQAPGFEQIAAILPRLVLDW